MYVSLSSVIYIFASHKFFLKEAKLSQFNLLVKVFTKYFLICLFVFILIFCLYSYVHNKVKSLYTAG